MSKQMRFCRYILFLILVTLSVNQSCIKEEFTLPTKVQFSFALSSVTGNDLLMFNKGSLLLRDIEFEGYRQTGGNYFFTHRFTPYLPVNIGEATGDSLMFDIPQGIYKSDDNGRSWRESNIGFLNDGVFFRPRTFLTLK